MDAKLLLVEEDGSRWLFIQEMGVLLRPVQGVDGPVICVISTQNYDWLECMEVGDLTLKDDDVEFIVKNDLAKHDARREAQAILVDDTCVGDDFHREMEKISAKINRPKERRIANAFAAQIGAKGLH